MNPSNSKNSEHLSEHLAARRADILGAVPFGVVLLNSNGDVLEVNAAAHRVLGLDGSCRTMKKLARRVFHPISDAPIAESDLPWQRALAGENVRDRNLAISATDTGDHRRLITVSAQRFNDPLTRTCGVLVVAFDRVQLLLRQTPLGDLAS